MPAPQTRRHTCDSDTPAGECQACSLITATRFATAALNLVVVAIATGNTDALAALDRVTVEFEELTYYLTHEPERR